MSKVIRPLNRQQGFIIKFVLPIVIIFALIGFIYWGSGSSTSENPVAKGVAKFYAEVRQAVKPGSSRLDDYTIELAKPAMPLTDQLKQRTKTVQPASKNWRGESKKRSFKENDTIKTALENYGREEGIDVIWDLKYDYIIKNHFAEQGNLKSLVNKIAKSIGTDYGATIESYYCPQERALVITTEADNYVRASCMTTMSSSQLRKQKMLEKQYQQDRQSNGY